MEVTSWETQPLDMPAKRQRTGYGSERAKAATTIQSAFRKAKKSSFERNVKRILSTMAESKVAFHNSGNTLTKFNSGIDSVGDMLQIVPAIAQGTGDASRIASQIRAQSLRVKGIFKLDINDVDDSTKLPSVMVRCLIVSLKTRPCYVDAQSASGQLASLLKKGATTVGFTGVLSDLNADVNTELFTVHHDEKFYLNQSYINAIGAAPPSIRLAQDITNTVKFMDVTVKCKNKILRYDEDIGSNVYPTNWGPFMLVGYSYLDGSAADVLDTKLGFQYETMLRYEDA